MTPAANSPAIPASVAEACRRVPPRSPLRIEADFYGDRTGRVVMADEVRARIAARVMDRCRDVGLLPPRVAAILADHASASVPAFVAAAALESARA